MFRRFCSTFLSVSAVFCVGGESAPGRPVTPEDLRKVSAPGSQTIVVGQPSVHRNTKNDQSTLHSIAELNKAIDADPNNGKYYFQRADLYERKGDFHHALSDLSDAVRYEPMNSQYYLSRARLYEQHGDHALAKADIAKAQSVTPRVIQSAGSAGAQRQAVRQVRRMNHRLAPN